jgi:ribosomal protein S3
VCVCAEIRYGVYIVHVWVHPVCVKVLQKQQSGKNKTKNNNNNNNNNNNTQTHIVTHTPTPAYSLSPV